MKELKEADVIINGHKLTFQESLTLRVAIDIFLMDLKRNGCGDDAHGKAMTEMYIQHAVSIQNYIMKKAK